MDNRELRKIAVTGPYGTYFISLPKKMVKDLNWKKGEKKVVSKEGESIVALKNISANETYSGAYLPDTDIFPETLLIEAAAQAALVLYHVSQVKEDEPRPVYFLGRVKSEFHEPEGDNRCEHIGGVPCGKQSYQKGAEHE